jgi:hypothetical protein
MRDSYLSENSISDIQRQLKSYLVNRTFSIYSIIPSTIPYATDSSALIQ